MPRLQKTYANHANPKRPKITPLQEQLLADAEHLTARIMIYRMGVAEYLRSMECMDSELDEAASVLRIASDLARQRREIHATMRGKK